MDNWRIGIRFSVVVEIFSSPSHLTKLMTTNTHIQCEPALEEVKGQRHAPAFLYPREKLATHYTGDWLGPRAGLDRCGKSLCIAYLQIANKGWT
jgi:hypothetical protein